MILKMVRFIFRYNPNAIIDKAVINRQKSKHRADRVQRLLTLEIENYLKGKC